MILPLSVCSFFWSFKGSSVVLLWIALCTIYNKTLMSFSFICNYLKTKLYGLVTIRVGIVHLHTKLWIALCIFFIIHFSSQSFILYDFIIIEDQLLLIS